MTFPGSQKIGNSEEAALTRLYSLVMACERHSVSVTQPKVGVVYESNFLKNSEENVILCLLCMGSATASVFTRWRHPNLLMSAHRLSLPRAAVPSLIGWPWQGCQTQEEGRPTHPERERPHLQETVSRKTSWRPRATLHWKAGFHPHPTVLNTRTPAGSHSALRSACACPSIVLT